jgi:hypothetical protein
LFGVVYLNWFGQVLGGGGGDLTPPWRSDE